MVYDWRLIFLIQINIINEQKCNSCNKTRILTFSIIHVDCRYINVYVFKIVYTVGQINKHNLNLSLRRSYINKHMRKKL